MGAKVRLARAEELDRLPDIERSAAERFRSSAHDAIADGEPSPDWFYRPLAEAGLVFVAETDGEPVGFAGCEAFDDALHIWELAVALPNQGQGIGRALIAAAGEAARDRGLFALTLTTFTNVPWNAPFYARLGFRILPEAEQVERLRQALGREASRGLTHRCAMRCDLAS